jgi:hypothetical protein
MYADENLKKIRIKITKEHQICLCDANIQMQMLLLFISMFLSLENKIISINCLSIADWGCSGRKLHLLLYLLHDN